MNVGFSSDLNCQPIQTQEFNFNINQQHNCIQNLNPMKSSTEEFTKVATSCLQLFNSSVGNKLPLKLKKTKLNLFGKGITHIKVLNKQEIQLLYGIKQIDLSHNALASILNLKPLPFSQLNLSHNKILEQDLLLQLFIKQKNSQLSKNLKKITLKGNPFLKKPLSPEMRRWFFSVENDLDLFSKEEYEYLDLFVQRFIEKIMLQNLLNKVSLNLQFLQEFNPKIEEDFQKLILTRPQDYFKILKRQMEWKIQAEPLASVRKQVIMNMPLQLFGSGKQKIQGKQFASQLVLELRKRNENLIKHNKQIVQRIQQAIFNYLTQRKMIVEKQQKASPQIYQSKQTPYKNLFVLKRNSQLQSSKRHLQDPYPEANTPIYTKRYSTSKPKTPNALESELKAHQLLTQRTKFVQAKSQRNPFEQIAKEMEESGRKESNVMRQVSKNKENIILSPSKYQQKHKRIEIKNSSKTLFELSQSLLQRPVINSDESLHFEFEDGVAQSQIEKMFFQILAKLNPIYHLLYSPIESLKSTEKNSLITNLLQLLKQKLKYIEKLQKFKLLYETEKQKYEELSILHKKQKENMEAIWSRKQDISLQLKQVQNQVNHLSKEVQVKTQQIFILIEENESLKDQLRRFHDIKLQRDEEQRIQELIRSKRENAIQYQCFDLLNKRADKMFTFKHRMQKLQSKENRNILYTCFLEITREAKISKNFKLLSSKVMSQNFLMFKSTIQPSIQIRKDIDRRQSLFKKFIVVSRARQMIRKVRQMKSFNRNHTIARKTYDRKLKRKMLRLLERNVELQKGIEYERMVVDFRKQSKQRLKKWVFDEWLIWQKGLLHKQVQVRVNHEGVLACNVIERLCNFTSKQHSYHNKAVALQLYLRDMRKFNSFNTLFNHMSTETQKWKMKLFKINMFTKRIFFDDFLSGVRFKKNKRKIKENDKDTVCRKLQFNELSEYKLKKKIIQYKTKNTKNKIRHCYFIKVVEEMIITRKQIEVERLLTKNKIESFLDQLKGMHKAKSVFKAKQREAELVARAYYAAQANRYSVSDLFSYFRCQQRFKRSLVKFFINKNKRLLERTFYQFRVNCLEQKALFFEEKLKELGPDIDLIEERQIQTNIEKVSLCRQIQLKNQQMQEYEKEVQELRLLLEAKEIKYAKLKDLYAETIEINAREREYYEAESSIMPESLPYEYKFSVGSKNEDIYQAQKNVKFESKPDLNRHRIHTTSGYSPERDTMMSKQKRKVNDFMNAAKQTPSQNVFSVQRGTQKTEKTNNKDKLSEFYPSFRRF